MLSIFEKYWRFLTLLGTTVADFPQRVRKLLGKLEKNKYLIAVTAILMLKIEAMEVKIAGKKEKRIYWAEALIKLVALEKENNIQAVPGCIELNLKLNTH